MNYKNKLKSRLYVAIIYIALGLIMIAGAFVMDMENDFVSSFGLLMIVMGIVRIRNYFIITRNEASIRKQEIAETDERNLSIINKAKSVTFSIYILISGIAVIVLSLLDMRDIAKWISYSICLLLVIYWISYWIIRKKS